MKKHPFEEPNPKPNSSLRDAYKVSGFRVRARIENYDDLKHPAFVLTLDRRSKKRFAVAAASCVAVVMDNVGDGCATSVAGIEKFISIFQCAA